MGGEDDRASTAKLKKAEPAYARLRLLKFY
jgi:hypothetical protein